jgi:hypothetical protein
MKKKASRIKVNLNKKTIANLNNLDLISIEGGATTFGPPCGTYSLRTECETCDKICPTETPCTTFTLVSPC